MNILFLTISSLPDIEEYSLYSDLLRCLRDKGNEIYSVCPNERRLGKNTELVEKTGYHSLKVKTLNITSCNSVEKGISTLTIEYLFLLAIKKYFSNVKFDLVLYPTPPITLSNVIKYIKKRDGARSYLLLKDIFPQNAVDLGMMQKTGLKGYLYRYFRKREKQLYFVSDKIGCMSQANVDYVLKHNPEVSADKVEVCPNAIDIRNISITSEEKLELRKKYGIPMDKKIFVYGGNLGKPQGIPFIIDCLRSVKDIEDAFFFIVGDGTEFEKLHNFIDKEKPSNAKLMKKISREDYNHMLAACDVGLIFLDYRFTIPNFPSRLLTYMQAGLPVLACTDSSTDIGRFIERNNFGWWCESNKIEDFCKIVRNVLNADFSVMICNELRTLFNEFSTADNVNKILMESKL